MPIDEAHLLRPCSDLLRLFDYGHLPQSLQTVSKPFNLLAHQLFQDLGANQFSYEALKALKISKDWAVNSRVVNP